jgi:hypothetical protein
MYHHWLMDRCMVRYLLYYLKSSYLIIYFYFKYTIFLQMELQRYNWTIVESDVKQHKLNLNKLTEYNEKKVVYNLKIL